MYFHPRGVDDTTCVSINFYAYTEKTVSYTKDKLHSPAYYVYHLFKNESIVTGLSITNVHELHGLPLHRLRVQWLHDECGLLSAVPRA